MVQNDCPGIIGEEWEWYPLGGHNLVPSHLVEIQKPPPQGHPVLTSALEPILVGRMPGVAEKFKSVIDKMTFAIDFKLISLLHAENANLTHQNLRNSLREPKNRCNMHLVSYHSLTTRAKPSSNGQVSHCSWSFGIFDESHRDKTKNSVGWQIVMNVRIGFKLQVTTMPGFHSLYNWCFQTMWRFSGALEDPEDDTVMEKHGAEAQYSAVKSSRYAIQTPDEYAPHTAAHWLIKSAKPWTIRTWSAMKPANGKPLVWIRKENAHLIDLKWTEK